MMQTRQCANIRTPAVDERVYNLDSAGMDQVVKASGMYYIELAVFNRNRLPKPGKVVAINFAGAASVEPASATATVVNGVITAVSVDYPGKNYASTPTVTASISPAPVRAAQLRAVLNGNGQVIRVDVVDGGFGFKAGPVWSTTMFRKLDLEIEVPTALSVAPSSVRLSTLSRFLIYF